MHSSPARPARGALLALGLALLGTVLPVTSPITAAGVAQAADSRSFVRLNRTALGETQRLSVGLNKSLVIDLPEDAHDILVANPEVADAVTRSARRIYIFAKEVGETNIFVFDKDGAQLLSIDLSIERDIVGLEANLSKYIPGSDIKVEMVNDNVVLTGTVPTPLAAKRAVDLATAFVTGGEATTNNFNSNTSGGTGTTIVFGEDDRQKSQIINLLQIDGEDQVNLKVTIAEIQRTVVKQLGVNLTGNGMLGGFSYDVFTDNPLALNKPLSRSRAGVGTPGEVGNPNNKLNGLLHALEQTGVMRTLAEPSLTAISGETASFKVGGTYNLSQGKDEQPEKTTFVNGIPQRTPATVTFESKEVEYGVGLTFTPLVLSAGRISLKMRTEVSEPTSEGGYNIPRVNGGDPSAPFPGLRKREAETTVELPSGGTMVIAGLMKDDVRQTVSGFPGLSKIPVLGALFRSREFERYETELVILVTPYLVRPVARAALARPDDNFNPTGDGTAMFLGRLNRIYGTVEGEIPPGRYHGRVGFIYK